MNSTVVRIATAAGLLVIAGCSSSIEPVGAGADPVASASLGGRRPFPADNPWNRDISRADVDPASAKLIASCGVRGLHPDFGTTYGGAPNGIPYVVVSSGQPKVPVTFDYADESDPGP
jgi:hypothetical protein